MSNLYENPMAPPGYVPEEPDIQLYTPLDPRMQQFLVNENFVSLLDLLDESLLKTPPESDEETKARVEKTQRTKPMEMQQNTIALEKPETLDSLHAFIAEYKNRSILSEKDVKDKRRQRKKRSKHRKRSEKLNKSSSRHKNKSSCNSSTQQDPQRSSRSNSQSTSSERSPKHHDFITLDKSSFHITSPNHPSASPQLSTSHYKSRSISPRQRLPSRQQYSTSHRSSIRTSPHSPSPTRSSPQRYTSPSRKSRSQHYSSYRKSHIRTLSRSPSPTRSSPQRYTSPSRRSRSQHYSSYRKSHIRTLSRSPSPARSSPQRRTSPSRRAHSSHYSSYRKSHIRTPSRSPSIEKLPSHYKLSNYERSSKHRSSRSNKSPSCLSPPSPCGSHVRSPERPSSRYKCYEKSSKPCASPRYRSPLRHQSPSPRRSPIRSDKSSNRPKSSVDEKSNCNKSPSNKSPIRQRKFPIEDNYTRILAEEMVKRQIWDGSDLDEEGEVTEQNAVTDVETVTPVKKEPVKKEPVDHTKDSQNEQILINEEVEDDKLQSNSRLPKSKFLEQEIKSDSLDQKGFTFNSFYCSSCQLSLNSEITWQSHITGKKHAKVLKLQTVHEVAKGSIAIASTSSFESEDTPRFGQPAAGKIRHQIDDVPRIQPVIDNALKGSLLGLQFICEIRSKREVTYYCELCDAPCSAHSIMPHLMGYKHQLRFLKEIDYECYERNKSRSKREYELQLSRILFRHEQKYGRDRMKVFEEWDEADERPLYDPYSQAGPSWRNSPPIKRERNTEYDSEIRLNDECLDTSKADFYCKLCDAHMNNMNMWESHVRGKRHLKNAKKIPGESISKVRSVKAPPHVVSKLDRLISEKAADEIIVGLDSIRETQGPNGENYTCFPCGSNCTNFDIVDHLLLTKHKIRYLEKLVADGKPNGITTISQVEIHDDYFRKHLIDDECRKMMEMYGSGSAEVYLIKK